MNGASSIDEELHQEANVLKKELSGGQLVLAGLLVLLALGIAFIWEISKSTTSYHDPKAFSLGQSAFEDGRFEDALHWFKSAANQGEAQAQYALAMMYIHGQTEDPNPQQAKSWLVRSAQQGFPQAQYQLGILLEKEGSANQNYEHWLNEAAKQGMGQAILHLIQLYDARNTPEDSQKATTWLIKAKANHLGKLTTLTSSLTSHIQAQAQAGQVPSMFLLANIYRQGSILETNKTLAYRWMLKAAQQHHIKASEAVAGMLLYGEGVPIDMKQAFHWYQASDEAGSTHAKSALGCMLVLGLGTPPNIDQGVAFLKQAAQTGNPSAARNLGIIEVQGLIEETNDDAAIQWFKQASHGDDGVANNSLGVMYALGRGVHPDMALARKYFEKVQETDNQAQFNLAIIEARGLTDYARDDEAVKWLQRSESNGNHRASFVLGLLYTKGKGVRQDTSQAIQYYERAIQHGSMDAKYNLAMLEYHGDHGLPLDAARAKELLVSLAKSGDVGGQNMLASIELNGLGMDVNIHDALHWYQKAANHGYAMSQFNLGNMYRSGIGAAQSDRQAAYWYQQANQQDYPPAQNALAYMYIHGRGIPRNLKKAKQLLQKAGKNLRQAQDNLQRLAGGNLNFILLGATVDSRLRGNLLATGDIDLSQWFQMRKLPFP
ncbi:MAG: tetratricopeptide repeat protein [Mariprofundaceae bacterium]|nr:tetratricopeptide repeat protein [Mariprofundaceae bacterium]